MVEAHYWLIMYLGIGLAFAITCTVTGIVHKTWWIGFRVVFDQTWLWPGYIIAMLLHKP